MIPPADLSNLFSVDLDSGWWKDNVNVFADVANLDADFNFCWRCKINIQLVLICTTKKKAVSRESRNIWCKFWSVQYQNICPKCLNVGIHSWKMGRSGMFGGMMSVSRAKQEQWKLKDGVTLRWRVIAGVRTALVPLCFHRPSPKKLKGCDAGRPSGSEGRDS